MQPTGDKAIAGVCFQWNKNALEMLEIHLIINRCHQLQDICRDLFLWAREKRIAERGKQIPKLRFVCGWASTLLERNIVFAYLSFAASCLSCGVWDLFIALQALLLSSAGSVAATWRLSFSEACGILVPGPGSNPCPLQGGF